MLSCASHGGKYGTFQHVESRSGKAEARVLTGVVGLLQVKDFARVSDSIIGWGSSVGKWARIDNKSVIGEDVHVKVLLN